MSATPNKGETDMLQIVLFRVWLNMKYPKVKIPIEVNCENKK